MNILKRIFHKHNWININVGRFPLVAVYCNKCGIVRTGNCIYYNGTIFQHILKPKEAYEYIRKELEYVNHIENRWEPYRYKMSDWYKMWRLNDMELLLNFEKSERYKEILNDIKQFIE